MLYKFVDSIKVLPITQFAFRKGIDTTDALLLINDVQSFLDMRAETTMAYNVNSAT